MSYTKKDLEDIIKTRDNYKPDTVLWRTLNRLKANILEEIKPSTREEIIYYYQDDLKDIKEGFFETDSLPTVPLYTGRRSELEYAGILYRHPIPYIILKHKDSYFFILREKGSGEIRLQGKMGMVGGHVGTEGIITGMFRELEEEVAVTEDMIISSKIKGLIKSNEGVDQDHLGVIYEIEINTDKIKAEEDGVLSGLWINKKDLPSYVERFENWSKIIYDNILNQ